MAYQAPTGSGYGTAGQVWTDQGTGTTPIWAAANGSFVPSPYYFYAKMYHNSAPLLGDGNPNIIRFDNRVINVGNALRYWDGVTSIYLPVAGSYLVGLNIYFSSSDITNTNAEIYFATNGTGSPIAPGYIFNLGNLLTSTGYACVSFSTILQLSASINYYPIANCTNATLAENVTICGDNDSLTPLVTSHMWGVYIGP